MVKVIFLQNDDYIKSFKISGHADFADKGYDIVCAAVSALSETTLASLLQLTSISKLKYKRKDGFVSVELPDNLTKEQSYDSQLIIKTFKIGAEGISISYPKYVKLLIKKEV